MRTFFFPSVAFVAVSGLASSMIACTDGAYAEADGAAAAAEEAAKVPGATTASGQVNAGAAAASSADAPRVSLARQVIGGKVHTLGVRAYDGKAIEAVDLSAAFNEHPSYPIDLVTKHGFDAMAAAIAKGTPARVDVAALLPPMDETDAHIATAENYPEHQQETAGATGGTDVPFMFPKIARPTSSVSSVDRAAGDLLDYEVEMCVAFGSDIATVGDLENATFAVMVCNDVSDRRTQVLGADALNPETGKGFTDAKSRPGFFPLGPFAVVPKDGGAFIAARALTLSMNGQPRQKDSTSSMVWKIPKIVEEALKAGSEPRFELRGKPIALLPSGKITKGQIIMTGTPGGVVFRSPSQEFVAMAMAEWVTKGGPFSGSDPVTYVKKSYVEHLHEQGGFLMPGDAVACAVDALGAIHIDVRGSKQ